MNATAILANGHPEEAGRQHAVPVIPEGVLEVFQSVEVSDSDYRNYHMPCHRLLEGPELVESVVKRVEEVSDPNSPSKYSIVSLETNAS